jgi:hypothetical protein
MLNRMRLYFMLPDVASATATCNELLLARIEDRRMHFLAKRGTNLGSSRSIGAAKDRHSTRCGGRPDGRGHSRHRGRCARPAVPADRRADAAHHDTGDDTDRRLPRHVDVEHEAALFRIRISRALPTRSSVAAC